MPATPTPSTPCHFRRSFSAILRSPMTMLRSHSLKRSRSASLPPSSHSPLPSVILQTYSVSTDSIVLTALPTAPFCCHEDLLTMPRAQLEGVVRALNERLPQRMRIGVGEEWDEETDTIAWMSEAELRMRVEELVGIRPIVRKDRMPRSVLAASLDAPPAPKPTRTRSAGWRVPETAPWDMDVDIDEHNRMEDETSFTDAALSSPLAMRERTYSNSRRRSNTLSKLAILAEENEAETQPEEVHDETLQRASKRRRVSSYAVPTPQGSRLLENMSVSGSPLMAMDDNALFDELTSINANILPHSNEAAVTEPSAPVAPREDEDEWPAHTALSRRRSARIRQRASSAHATMTSEQSTNVTDPLVRAQTYTARGRETKRISEMKSTAEIKADTPTEFTIRLPFTSTPPQLNSAASSFRPRILRSHSRRSAGDLSTGPATRNGVLMRSYSERLPQEETAFVTIRRPRYRFGGRKTKERPAKGIEDELLEEASSVNNVIWDNNDNAPKPSLLDTEQSTLPALPVTLTRFDKHRPTSTGASTLGHDTKRSLITDETVCENMRPTQGIELTGVGEVLDRMDVDEI